MYGDMVKCIYTALRETVLPKAWLLFFGTWSVEKGGFYDSCMKEGIKLQS